MANNQQIAGSANIISGVPERVGMPVEAFKEVGAILTQRYYQNKQAHDSITTSLKNMPTIADEVDKPNLASVSKDVDESFKRVVETDNYHNATDTVMNVSKMLVTDDRIKGLQKNYASLTKWEEEFDKQAKEKGYNWSPYKDDIKKEIKKQYIKNGGSTDINGKAQGINLLTPTTNLNLEDEVLKSEQIASSVEKVINEQFGGQTSIPKGQLNLIEDETVRKVMSMMPYSEEKVKTEVRSKARIREAVENYLKTDTDYLYKLKEIVQFDHLKNTGRSEVLPEDLKSILKSKNSTAMYVAVSQSPIYQQEKVKLDNKYEERIKSKNEVIRNKAKSDYNKELNNLFSNESLLQDGIANIDKLESKKVNELYYNTLIGDKHDTVLSSGDRFVVNNVLSRDKKYFDNNFIETLFKDIEKSKEEAPILTVPHGSEVIDIENSILNDKSTEGQRYIVAKNSYEAMTKLLQNPATKNQVDMTVYRDAKSMYEGLNNKRKAYEDNLNNVYETMRFSNPNDYTDIDMKIRYNMQLMSGSKIPSTSNIPRTKEFIPIIQEYELLRKTVSNITSNDVLKLSTKELIKKYIPGTNKVSANFYNKLNGIISDSKNKIYKEITSTSEKRGTITVPVEYVTNHGEPTAMEQAVSSELTSALRGGSLIDASSNTLVDLSNIEDSNGDKVDISRLDLDNIKIRPVQGNGVFRNGNVYSIEVPISGTTKDGDPERKVKVDSKNFTVYWEAGKLATKELVTDYANKAIKRLNSPIASATSFQTATNALKILGSNAGLSVNSDPKQVSNSAWDVVNMLKNETGSFTKEFYLHKGDNIKGSTKLTVIQDDEGNKFVRFNDVSLDGKGNPIERNGKYTFDKPTKGFNKDAERIVSFEDLIPILGFDEAVGLDMNFAEPFFKTVFIQEPKTNNE